jgi:GTPase
VLPVLPEAALELGIPQKPARLLPGLEESQGALYEIGVADDGTFVGLTRDELDESLTNLQVMAGSLGCKIEILRRVIVGKCEWVDDSCVANPDIGQIHAEDLWVAEALVSPDWDYYRIESPKNDFHEDSSPSLVTRQGLLEGDHSSTEQIRISITGPTTAGKSSLLGTLTSSILDNGRGASRLSLLKHRHEISSGITSSVAHELIGYAISEVSKDTLDIANYSSGNVAAWDDVHAASAGGRLAFVSDLPGSVRYLKSTLRGLISWAPHYVLLCIPANCDDETTKESQTDSAEQTADISLALPHLALCIKLEVPTIVVITKLDLASRASLKQNLTKVLSVLKQSGRKPAMLPVQAGSSETADLHHVGPNTSAEIKKLISTTDDWSSTVPILLTSAVDASGIGRLHALLGYLPIPPRPPLRTISLPKTLSPPVLPTNIFDVDEVFAIPPSKVYSMSTEQYTKNNHGVVLCGLVRYGAISIGDELIIGPLLDNASPEQGSRIRAERHSETQARSESFRSRPLSGDFSTSFLQGSFPGKLPYPTQAHWQRVRVVSVRNLRLPVRKLVEDQVGTIGIEPLPPSRDEPAPRLGRVRKGTILASFPAPSSTSIPKSLLFHTGFVASFRSSEFASLLSPPLLLGGNAIVCIANIRSTVKVTCMALADDEVVSSPPSPTEPEFFSFDGDGNDRDKGGEPEVNDMVRSSVNSAHEDLKITCSFVTSVEWVEIGSRVLLMPGVSGALASAQNPGSPSGLEGFVGRVCDVVSSTYANT